CAAWISASAACRQQSVAVFKTDMGHPQYPDYPKQPDSGESARIELSQRLTAKRFLRLRIINPPVLCNAEPNPGVAALSCASKDVWETGCPAAKRRRRIGYTLRTAPR